MDNGTRFDLAFSNIDLTVIRANLQDDSADIEIDGEVFSVSPIRCEICDCWEPDCQHLADVRALVDQAERQDREDHARELDDLRAFAMGR